jgi:hypothetical protein
MSYHSNTKWTFEDDVTDEIIEEVIEGLKYHLELYGQYTPYAYIKFNAVDASIHFIGRLLDAQARDEDIDIAGIIERSKSSSAGEVIERVMERMAS